MRVNGSSGRCATVGCKNDWVYPVVIRYDGMDFTIQVCLQCGVAIDKLEVVTA